jgi:nicotinate phosphoribosyltransferase
MTQSLLDTDLYKLTMMQVVFEKYTSVNVRYDFKCRSGNVFDGIKNPSLFFIELQEAINELCELRFTKEELDYLRSIRFFKPNFLEYLRLFQLNRDYIKLGSSGDLKITITGPWISTILFEVPILAMVSELYHKHCGQRKIEMYDQSIVNITKKIDYIKSNLSLEELAQLRIVDLGTRRRFTFDNQRIILCMMRDHKCLAATSNVYFAKDLGITAAGTMAHEYLCAHQQLGRVEDSQKNAFQAWAEVYRGDLGIALSDTVGFDAFLRDFDLYFAKLFDGARHDSGDPYIWCDKLIRHYEKLRIDPKTKIAVFSDGLDFEKMVSLFHRFHYRIKCSFGIGTNLTNDVGVKPLQIVMKMVECNGRPVVKISDSIGKGMCLDPKFEAYVKRIFYREKGYVANGLK